MRSRLILLTMVLASGSTAAGVAAPWSFAGHSIVCEIAFQRLTDQGRALLFASREHDPDPSGTFFESCSWADQSRYADHRAT